MPEKHGFKYVEMEPEQKCWECAQDDLELDEFPCNECYVAGYSEQLLPAQGGPA